MFVINSNISKYKPRKLSSNLQIISNLNSKLYLTQLEKSLTQTLPLNSVQPTGNTITLPNDTIDIISVLGYDRGTNPPPLGQYYFDPDNLTLTLNPVPSSNLYYYALSTNSPTPIKANCADIPDTGLIRQLNCIGDITFSRSFEGHPTVNLKFLHCGDFNWCDYPNGRRYSLFGINWYQDTIEVKKQENKQNEVEINLVGEFAHPKYDKPVKKECRKTLSVAALAAIVGARYSGSTFPIRIDRSMAYDTSFSFRSELETRAITEGKFVYYSGGSIETRNWGTTTIHHIRPTDISSYSLSYSRPGDGAEIEDCLKLTNELYEAQVSFDFKETAVALQLLVTIEGATSAFDVGLPPSLPTSVGINNDNQSNQPLIDDIVYNPSVCFDNGGKTQSINFSYQIGGVETISNKRTYGFAFTSLDSYASVLGTDGHTPEPIASPPSQASLFKLTGETTTIHYFNSDNYLYKVVTNGWQLGRFKQESDQLEAINLQCQIDDEGDLAKKAKLEIERDLYKFTQRIPVNESTYYLLEDLGKYYHDIPTPKDCEPTAKFAKKKITSRLDTINTVDGDGNPVTSGTWAEEEDVTTILWTYPPEKFSVVTKSFNNSGGGLKNTSSIANYTEYSGRPSLQQKIIPLSDNEGKVPPKYYDKYLGKKFYLSTVGSESGSSSNISFPDLDDLATIQSIAETKLSIDNSKEVETVTVKLNQYNHNIQEGDRVSLFGKLYVVFNINSILTVTKNYELRTKDYKLTLGRLVFPKISLLVRE